jgi:hypothetical protein
LLSDNVSEREMSECWQEKNLSPTHQAHSDELPIMFIAMKPKEQLQKRRMRKEMRGKMSKTGNVTRM